MPDRTIRTLPKGDGEELRISLSEYKGHAFLNIRQWFRNRNGSMQPTQKGVTVPLRLLPDFASGVSQAATTALQEGRSHNATVTNLFPQGDDGEVIER
nr:transcriptional coactivator p15/PC4 family protein [Roseivivax marinus]